MTGGQGRLLGGRRLGGVRSPASRARRRLVGPQRTWRISSAGLDVRFRSTDIQRDIWPAIGLVQLFEPPLRVVGPVAALALRVRADPVTPAGLPVTPGNVGIEVEPVAMLEPDVAFVDRLHAWTASCSRRRKEQGRRREVGRSSTGPALLHSE